MGSTSACLVSTLGTSCATPRSTTVRTQWWPIHRVARGVAWRSLRQSRTPLWDRCGLPRPGGLPDACGGWSFEVRQVSWGHPAVKPTWLYVVGMPAAGLTSLEVRTGGEPTHKLRNRTAGNLPQLSRPARSKTPPAFRDFLLSIARRCRIETRQSE